MSGAAPRSDGKPARSTARRLRVGAQLLRTWQGRDYTVTVTDNGFFWGGHTYRSRSPIARKITGSPWSGPAFFGLNKTATARGDKV